MRDEDRERDREQEELESFSKHHQLALQETEWEQLQQQPHLMAE